MKTTYLVNRSNVVFVWWLTKISHSQIWNGNCQLPPFTCLQYFRNIRKAIINNQPFPGLHLHQRRLLGSSRLQAVCDVHCLIDGTFVMLMLWDFWKRMISLIFGKGWFRWSDLDLGLCSSMWKTATLLGWYRFPITWRGIKVTCCYRQIEYLFYQPKVRHGIIQWNYSGHREGWERLHVWANWTWTLYLWWK